MQKNIQDFILPFSFRWDIYRADFYLDDIETFKARALHGNWVRTVLLAFRYFNSLSATIILTLERYFFVTKTFVYRKVSSSKTLTRALHEETLHYRACSSMA